MYRVLRGQKVVSVNESVIQPMNVCPIKIVPFKFKFKKKTLIASCYMFDTQKTMGNNLIEHRCIHV